MRKMPAKPTKNNPDPKNQNTAFKGGGDPGFVLELGLQNESDPHSGQHPNDDFPSAEKLKTAFPQLEILEVIGAGGMGVVYRARQRSLDRFVALKIVKPDLSSDPAFVERFSREARAMARLSHPNIVSVYDFGTTDGMCFLIMEFVDGLNLRQIHSSKKLRPHDALSLIPRICDALQYAHDQNVVHRDIKPENILITEQGEPKIADFGLAKLIGEENSLMGLTETRQALGTPRYLAPEQMDQPLEVDHRADIFSLGVVFYEMLTGQIPLGRFAPPSELAAIDRRLDDVVLRAMERDRHLRYQHARELESDIRSIHHADQGGSTYPVEKPILEKTGAGKNLAGQNSPGVQKRSFCYLTAVGMLLSPFGIIMAGLMMIVVPDSPETSSDSFLMFQTLAKFLLLPLGIISPFACTMLGAVSVYRIRASRGRVYGMPFAVAVMLLYPLLVMDGIILAIIPFQQNLPTLLLLLIGLVVVFVLDIVIYGLVLWLVTRNRQIDFA